MKATRHTRFTPARLAAYLQLEPPMKTIELVLPSGRFASMRRITWFDRVMSISQEIEVMVMCLACRITTIDGEALTMAQAQDMELQEANPIISAVIDQLTAAFASRGIA